MIKTKKELKECLKIEKSNYEVSSFWWLLSFLRLSDNAILYDFQRKLRLWEYHLNNGHKIRANIYKLLSRSIGRRYNISIGPNCFDVGLHIMHLGNILVNTKSKIGKNCCLHVNTAMVASNGVDKGPTLGDNCILGVGSTIVGDITLGNNIVIGAGAVVTKSFDENHITLGGVPAKIISRKAIM